MVDILSGAEPFAIDGNSTGVLLIHGFTGSTQSIRYLGEELNRRFGLAVAAPRLPGHGTSPAGMARTGYRDWLRATEAALRELASRKERTIVAGLSMGGTIALNLAARFPDLVDAVAPICAPVATLPSGLADALMQDPPPDFISGIGSDIRAKGVSELAYREIPVRAIEQFAALIASTHDMLDRVTCPALVIQAEQDHVVQPSNAPAILVRLASKSVRLVWLQHSFHVATLDEDKDLVVDLIGDFSDGRMG